jgi:hypothetical protein
MYIYIHVITYIIIYHHISSYIIVRIYIYTYIYRVIVISTIVCGFSSPQEVVFPGPAQDLTIGSARAALQGFKKTRAWTSALQVLRKTLGGAGDGGWLTIYHNIYD